MNCNSRKEYFLFHHKFYLATLYFQQKAILGWITQTLWLPEVQGTHRRIWEGLWVWGQAQGPAVGKSQDREYALLRYLGTSLAQASCVMRDLDSGDGVSSACVLWAAWWLPGLLSGIMTQERPRPVFIIHNHLHLHLRYARYCPSQPQRWNVSSICARNVQILPTTASRIRFLDSKYQ